jgi:hypothetical protein
VASVGQHRLLERFCLLMRSITRDGRRDVELGRSSAWQDGRAGACQRG